LARDSVLKYKNGHYLQLYTDARSSDGFGWRCRTPINKQKKKCDYYRSIHVDTFFHKSDLSFIVRQLRIAQHTPVDWTSFHREVVFKAMITNHSKIGKFKIFKFN